MKFTIRKASDWKGNLQPAKNAVKNEEKDIWEIEVNTFEELMEIHKLSGESIIISHDWTEVNEKMITIYDDHLE